MEEHCVYADVEFHKRYLVEIARETLTSDQPAEIIYADALNCRSPWLNELKARRLAEHGSVNLLDKSWKTSHLQQLSPCLRELLRLSDSPHAKDKKQRANQMAEFVRRREGELAGHYEKIKQCALQLPAQMDETMLQAFFAEHLAERFQSQGAVLKQIAQPQGRRQYGVTFELTKDVVFVVVAIMIFRSPEISDKIPSGRLSAAFRLMNKNALESPIFLPEEQLVVRLADLLPNHFNDYGLFEGREEFCLNVLAWETAIEVLLPDALRSMRSGSEKE
jgi:hypothetical protein